MSAEQPGKKEMLLRSFVRGSEDRLIEVMEKDERGSGYAPATFPLSSVEKVKKFGEKRSLLILHSGVKIPVSLPYEDLKHKIYRPDHKTDNMGVLDLKEFTGRGVTLTPVETAQIGAEMEDGSLYLGFYKDRDWFVAAEGSSVKMHFNQAAQHAKNLDAHGHCDWELPDQSTLQALFNNRMQGKFKGTYQRVWYWSSVGDPSYNKGFQQCFDDGGPTGTYDDQVFVRCVRSEPRF